MFRLLRLQKPSMGALRPTSVRAMHTFSDDMLREIQVFSRKRRSTVGLKALLETGRGEYLKNFEQGLKKVDKQGVKEKVLIQVASFLHRELPIRFAHRAVQLDAIPLLQTSKHVVEVSSWYKQSFIDIRSINPPNDMASEEIFFNIIENVYSRHSNTLLTMARGAHDIRNQHFSDSEDDFAEFEHIQTELNNFYQSRIDIRTLIGHYMALRNSTNFSDDCPHAMVGIIDEKASPYAIALNAIEDAKYMCTRTHGDAPEVEMRGRLDLTFPQIPDHIHYILVELLKNSMRATVEFHGVDNPMPPIKVIIADGEDNEDVVIKVSDEGGGIKRSNMKKIWSYLFTTADKDALEAFVTPSGADAPGNFSDFNTSSPLAGLGYGLPISRCYARHFGGDLTLMSMEGYGTDGYVYLSRI